MNTTSHRTAGQIAVAFAVPLPTVRLFCKLARGLLASTALVVASAATSVSAAEAEAFIDAQGMTMPLRFNSDLPVYPEEADAADKAVGNDQTTMLRHAEAAYRDARYELAMARFALVAAMQNDPFAWLRIGNIWHRRGRSAMAIDAYARAAGLAGASQLTAGIAKRARKNLAMLGLALAEHSVQQLDTSASPGQWEREIRRRLARLESAIVVPEAPIAGVASARATGRRSGRGVSNVPGASVTRSSGSSPRVSTIRIGTGS